MAKIAWQLKANRDRNRPMLKMGHEQLEQALAAHDRIQAVSDAIRAGVNLPPVPESNGTQAARARLAELAAKAPAKRKPSRATSAASGSPRDALTPDALEQWRRRNEREGEEIREAAVAMFRERVAGATRIGVALGVKRQRVYQLADAA